MVEIPSRPSKSGKSRAQVLAFRWVHIANISIMQLSGRIRKAWHAISVVLERQDLPRGVPSATRHHSGANAQTARG